MFIKRSIVITFLAAIAVNNAQAASIFVGADGSVDEAEIKARSTLSDVKDTVNSLLHKAGQVIAEDGKYQIENAAYAADSKARSAAGEVDAKAQAAGTRAKDKAHNVGEGIKDFFQGDSKDTAEAKYKVREAGADVNSAASYGGEKAKNAMENSKDKFEDAANQAGNNIKSAAGHAEASIKSS